MTKILIDEVRISKSPQGTECYSFFNKGDGWEQTKTRICLSIDLVEALLSDQFKGFAMKNGSRTVEVNTPPLHLNGNPFPKGKYIYLIPFDIKIDLSEALLAAK